MIGNFNHAMSSGISIGTGAGTDGGRGGGLARPWWTVPGQAS